MDVMSSAVWSSDLAHQSSSNGTEEVYAEAEEAPSAVRPLGCGQFSG